MQQFLMAGVCAITLACLAGVVAAQPAKKQNADTAALVNANTGFACELYRQLSQDDGNLFFSPYSISNALAMTYAGARGKTAADMARTLQLPFEGDRLHPAFAALIQELNKPGQKRSYQLSIANRLWGQKDYGFAPEFTKLTAAAYGAGLEEVDFENATEVSRQRINAWVEKETQQRIKNLLPKDSLARDTRLVLTNAIYFKANWQDIFSDKATKREDFKLASGKTVQADMMHQTEFLKLFENDMFQILEIPYENRELSMMIVLPRKVDGLPAVEKSLTADNLQKWLTELKAHRVKLSLPKFTFTAEFKLKKVLTEMGMGIAFSKGADFSGMTTREKLFIDAVIHKAFVAVDEKGTEAAAATGVTMRPTSAPIGPDATFRADHPFVFLIRERATGSVLFLGRVAQP